MRNKLPPLICFVCGIAFLIQFFVPWDPIENDMMQWATNSIIIVSVFALAIGLASLVKLHGNKISRRAPGWGFSIVTLTCVVIVAIIGIVPANFSPETSSTSVAKTDIKGSTNLILETSHSLFGYQTSTEITNTILIAGSDIQTGTRSIPLFDWFYNYIFYPLSATTFSLLAFYMMSATYRAVRAKSWEAGLLLVAALIVLLGQVPINQIPFIGKYLACGSIQGISTFDYLKGLILQFPNTAAKRGIIIGVSLGALATSVKIIFGIEKPYMGGK